MILNKMKVYSPVMMLGVVSMLSGCSSQSGVMTRGMSEVEENNEREENNGEIELERDFDKEETYEQAAKILLSADKSVLEKAMSITDIDSSESYRDSKEVIKRFAELLEKYSEAYDENKKYVQDDLNQINIKSTVEEALEKITKLDLDGVSFNEGQAKLFLKNSNDMFVRMYTPTTNEVNTIINLFWGDAASALESLEDPKDYYNFLSNYIPTFKVFAANIENYRLAIPDITDSEHSIQEGLIYNPNSITDQINSEIQEALDLVKSEYCQNGSTPEDYEIRTSGDNNGWIIRNKNTPEDYMLLEGDDYRLVNAVGDLQPVTSETILSYKSVENIVVLDNAKQAYKMECQSRK